MPRRAPQPARSPRPLCSCWVSAARTRSLRQLTTAWLSGSPAHVRRQDGHLAPAFNRTLSDRILVPFPPEAPLSGASVPPCVTAQQAPAHVRPEGCLQQARGTAKQAQALIAPLHAGLVRADGSNVNLLYKRSFSVPSAWQGQRVMLHFGAVDYEATVFVNDQFLGVHRGG